MISTQDRADVLSLYNEYVTFGAFPELVDIKNKRAFLSSIYQTIYLGDIITRNKISNDFAIKLILKKIAESVTKPLSFSRLTNILKSTGMAIGKQTVINYVGYMTDSYLLFTLQNYAAKLVDKETSPKYYFMDNGKKFTLGESTLKDLIDGGIPFEQNSLNNSGNNVNKNYETDRYTADINDYVTMQFMFGNFTDSEQKAEDCVLSYVRYSHLFVPNPDYDASMNAEISEMMLDGAKQVNFSFPTTITKDQLLEKCSENAEVDGKIVKYSVDSEVYMGSSGYTFEFDDTTGQLKEVRISWLP